MGFKFGNTIDAVRDVATRECLQKLGASIHETSGTVSTIIRDGNTVQSHADLTDLDFANSGHTGFASSASLPVGANPTASVGPSTINGTASTFMRSDAAPSLANTAVTPASYTYASITVDAQGRLTAAANGTAPASAANPTASIGLSAVNGTAATFLRSDGAPALDQTIAPTWSGLHTFTNAAGINLGTVGGIIQTDVANSGSNVALTIRNSVSFTGSRPFFEVDWYTGSVYRAAFTIFSLAGSTKEMRLLYDSSNYFFARVTSTGGVTTGAVGSAPSLTFSSGGTITFTATTSMTYTVGTVLNLNSASVVVQDGMVISNAANTTGLKIGAAGDKLGFYSVTPVVRPAAFTQTYATASHTHANPTATAVATTAATNIAPYGYTTQAQADDIVTQLNALVTDMANVKQTLNAVIDDGQLTGLLQ